MKTTNKTEQTKKILFVCLGNICRSPTAQVILQKKMTEQNLDLHVTVDSAGTGRWHVGSPADPRSSNAAKKRGYDLSNHKARTLQDVDFYDFNLILAMDERNLIDIKDRMPENATAAVDLYLKRYDIPPFSVPDPYYGEGDGFNYVIDLLEQATDKLINELKSCSTT